MCRQVYYKDINFVRAQCRVSKVRKSFAYQSTDCFDDSSAVGRCNKFSNRLGNFFQADCCFFSKTSTAWERESLVGVTQSVANIS